MADAKWTITKASEHGDLHLTDRLIALEDEASMEPFYKQYVFATSMDNALKRGDLRMVQWQHRYLPSRLVDEGLDSVIRQGNWDPVAWLCEHHGSAKLVWSGHEMKSAAWCNRLDLMRRRMC